MLRDKLEEDGLAIFQVNDLRNIFDDITKINEAHSKILNFFRSRFREIDSKLIFEFLQSLRENIKSQAQNISVSQRKIFEDAYQSVKLVASSNKDKIQELVRQQAARENEFRTDQVLLRQIEDEEPPDNFRELSIIPTI